MVSLDLSSVFKVDVSHGVSRDELRSKASLLSSYLEKIDQRKQAFYQVIDDVDVSNQISAFVNKNKHKYAHVLVLGIGGSALGTRCLQQSLMPLYVEELRKKEQVRLHVLDNIDPAFISQIEPVIEYERTLFMVVSRSGSTLETLAHYFYFRSQCEARGLAACDHFVFVTASKSGFLYDVAMQDAIPLFIIPENVGGRFSVLTAVGLLPACFAGIQIDRLLSGAKFMRDAFLSTDFDRNIPFQLAALQYILYRKNKSISVLMPYAQRLIRFTDWYAQLLAESTGKKLNDHGEEIYCGITPVSALGATDQHSLCQLFNEGPNDKFFIFINVAELGPKVPISSKSDVFGEEFSFYRNLSFNRLIQVEERATKISLTRNQRPNVTLNIDAVNEYTLGELFMLFQCVVAFLGEFFEINVFDQPGVELSKRLTREFLEELD